MTPVFRLIAERDLAGETADRLDRLGDEFARRLGHALLLRTTGSPEFSPAELDALCARLRASAAEMYRASAAVRRRGPAPSAVQ